MLAEAAKLQVRRDSLVLNEGSRYESVSCCRRGARVAVRRRAAACAGTLLRSDGNPAAL